MQRSGSKAGRGASGGRGGRAAANGSAPSEEGKAADRGSNKADAGLLKMNYFAALSGVGDADAHKTALSAEEEQRRRAAAVGNGTAAASSRRSGGKEGTGKATSGLKQPLVWIDLEMTGLDVESDAILQIAVICTGEWACTLRRHVHGSLEELIEGPELAIHQPDDVLATMNEWIVDVSTVGELARRWFPKEHARGPRKKNTHTAMSDIRESIEQLIYFRRTIFKRWSGANLP
ncbi:Oligoribonuclease [Chlorella vulgaris]